MKVPATSPTWSDMRQTSERLNKGCFCITLDRTELCRAVEREVSNGEFCEVFLKTRPHLFSNVAVFVPQADLESMERIVRAIESASRLPDYKTAALAHAPDVARHDYGPLGVFMGYDFHLAEGGPKLIEVNTNAGGAFLNALAAKAQHACCAEVQAVLHRPDAEDFESAVVRMFLSEWTRQRGAGSPRRIAIVDDKPQEQYLYPEFVVAERLLTKHGISTVIADAGQLHYQGGKLLFCGDQIDLVYNRLVDFSFTATEHAALRSAYSDDAVVVTPNPYVHAMLADKRNLALLSDQATLKILGLPREMLSDLAGVPRTWLVTPDNYQQLWSVRKKLFFKPVAGYGSKAVYRGDKLTRRVWDEIIRGEYVAQEFAAPGERMVMVDGSHESRKADLRLYTYDGEVLLKAARLYQGQATNLRTSGGGFAPVFAV